MKKIVAGMALMLVASMAIAKPVSPERARTVATNVLHSVGGGGRMEKVPLPVDYRFVYLFVADSGFVVVSADDCVRPVLAYSATAHYADSLPVQVAEWLKAYDEEIEWRVDNGLQASLQTLHEWDVLKQSAPEEPLFSVVVPPLLSTSWKQGEPYNNLCPYDTAGAFRCVTGCVATAAAQVMRYWNHPAVGTGQHSYTHNSYGMLSANFATTTYQWSQMPSSITSASPSAQISAVATLMYHVGVALEMDYGRSSGATTGSNGNVETVCAENALKTYFGYSRAMRHIVKTDISDSLWCSFITAELVAGRPVIYSGRDTSSGHSFVCDGCDASGYFHFNWGWGGYCDGYYTIGALNPSPGGTGGSATSTYNLSNGALFGIYPAAATHQASYPITVTTTDPVHGAASTVSTHAYGDTISILATTAAGYRFVRWTDGAPYNPRVVIVDSARTFTAIVEPIVRGRNVGYCGTNYRTAISTGSSANHHWAIKLEPSDLVGQTALESVQVYDKGAALHNLYIYKGGVSAPQTRIYSKQVNLTGSKTMVDIVLDSLVPVDTAQPLWIVLNCSTLSYPAPATYYAGHDNSCWTSSNGSTWRALSLRYSYIIRAHFVEGMPCSVSASADHGHVSGSGSYRVGQVATLTAIADACHTFDHWSDGSTSNPRHVVLAGDTALHAVCVPVTLQSVSSASACDSFMWGDTLRLTSGIYSQRFVSAEGCDSIAVLDLTLNRSARTVVHDTAHTAYTWNGRTLTEGGLYVDTLATVHGCDSIVMLVLTITTTEGIPMSETPQVSLAPNPACSHVSIVAPCKIVAVELYDNLGRLMLRSTGSDIDVSGLRAGHYTLRVSTATAVVPLQLIKQ